MSRAENTGNREPIKTRARACTIVPEFVGKKFAIYNGKTFRGPRDACPARGSARHRGRIRHVGASPEETPGGPGWQLLQAKRDTETLTNEEHQELIRLSDESEEVVAKRLEGCNNHKYTRTEAPDPIDGAMVPLFNPRTHRWADHFIWSSDTTGTLKLVAIELKGSNERFSEFRVS